jgi:molybdopterin-guanine dinucleotide biosynthesis protein A
MGRDKALLPVSGRPLALTVAEALRAAGAARVLAVGGDEAALTALGLEVVADRHPGEGPLGGILTALAATEDEVVVALACDLPNADPGAVQAVVGALGDADVAAPRRGGRLELLHAAWARRSEAHLAEAFAAGERAVHRAVQGMAVAEVEGLDDRHLDDVDEPEDLAGYPASTWTSPRSR